MRFHAPIVVCLSLSALFTGAPSVRPGNRPETLGDNVKSGRLEMKLTELQRSMAPVVGIDADFKQLKKLSLFSKTLLITGRMTISPPRFFKWEILSPLKSSVIVDDGEVTTWDEETNEKGVLSLKDNPIAGGVWTQMDAFFMGRFDELKKLYKIELVSESPATLRFAPLAEPLSKVMKNVTLVFAERGGLAYLKKVEMVEKEGDSTTIDFTNVELRTKSGNPK